MHSAGKQFSIAVGASSFIAHKAYNIRNVSNYVDYIFLMTYDYYVPSNRKTGHNAPYDEVVTTVNWWIDQGAPKNKLVVGLAAYGHSFTLQNPNSHEVGASTYVEGPKSEYTSEPGSLPYMEVCTKLKNGWTRVWDAKSKVPYAYNGNQWISYDDVDSIREKVNFIKSKKLAGAMWWTIADDDFRDFGGNGKFPLIKCAR